MDITLFFQSVAEVALCLQVAYSSLRPLLPFRSNSTPTRRRGRQLQRTPTQNKTFKPPDMIP